MRLSHRSLWAGALSAGVLPSRVARAQGPYPGSGTVKLIVGFPAGGSQGNVGRILADRLSAYWRSAGVVENVAGAGSNIAMDRAAKGAADGGQILIVPPGLATNQFLYAKLAFDPVTDLVPLPLVATFPNLLCVRNSLPLGGDRAYRVR